MKLLSLWLLKNIYKIQKAARVLQRMRKFEYNSETKKICYSGETFDVDSPEY